MDPPVLRCLVAYPFAYGHVVKDPILVDLEDVPAYLQIGFQAVGPDPEDERVWYGTERTRRREEDRVAARARYRAFLTLRRDAGRALL